LFPCGSTGGVTNGFDNGAFGGVILTGDFAVEESIISEEAATEASGTTSVQWK